MDQATPILTTIALALAGALAVAFVVGLISHGNDSKDVEGWRS